MTHEMKKSDTPKVILNEGYIDFRDCSEKLPQRSNTWSKNSTCTQKSKPSNIAGTTPTQKIIKPAIKNKHVVNSGLKNLVNSYSNSQTLPNNDISKGSSTRKPGSVSTKWQAGVKINTSAKTNKLKSQSELMVVDKAGKPSEPKLERRNTPITSGRKTDLINSSNVQSSINRFTMTKAKDIDTQNENQKNINKSLEDLLKLVDTETPSRCKAFDFQPQWKDSRLREKYSVLKVPWKRTYTLPVFSKPSLISKDNFLSSEYFDRKTYLYDDGTEIDSTYIDHRRRQYFSYALQNQYMALMFIGATICGLLLMSFIIWFLFGTDFLKILFKPKHVEENIIKRTAKYLGGCVIYFITTVFKGLGDLFSIPTQQVYQSPPEYYHWPAMQYN